MKKYGNLVLVRHGQSRWNLLNLFTGWIDVPLSDTGIREARQCSKHCESFNYDAAFASDLGRARETLLIILSKQRDVGVFQHKDKRNRRYHQMSISKKTIRKIFPIFSSEKLNERAYGKLQGMNKNSANKLYGKEQVFKWRREFKSRPPAGESLKDVYLRTIPYFEKEIQPRIRRGETVLVVAHGNTLRALIKFLEKVSDSEIPFIDLPNGKPIVYECRNDKFKIIDGKYKFKRPLR